jgi:hypothetical protein
VNVSRETVRCAVYLLLRERVGGAAFFFRRFGVGFVEAEDEKHAPPSTQGLAARTLRRRCIDDGPFSLSCRLV